MLNRYALLLPCILFVLATPFAGHCETLKAEDISYNLGVFGDIDYATEDRDRQHDSFFLGEFDLYGTADYKGITFLTELLVEFDEQETELDMERIWIGHSFSDLLTLRAGRHHASLGYWNRTYHHGKQLFTTVERPSVVAWEHDGGVMPMHIVGLEAEGRLSTGAANLRYELQIGNGPTITTDNILGPNNSSDDNSSKQWVARLSGTPAALPGFTVGLSGTAYKIALPADTIHEKIIGLDVSYIRGELELLGEYFMLQNSDRKADIGYAQAAYNILKYSITPYVRYERTDVEDGDPYMDALGGRKDRTQGIAGVKYDVNERNSLKAQYRRDREEDSDTKDVFELQWAFAF